MAFSYVTVCYIELLCSHVFWLCSPLGDQRKLTETRQALLIPEAFKLASIEHNFTINERDYTKVISLCGQATFWQDVCGLLENMEEMNITPTVFSSSAAISACAKGGQWQQAIVLLFEAMARVKIQPNTISYNTTISACEKGGEWQQALVLFEAMFMAAISADVTTYNAAISACGLGQPMDKGTKSIGRHATGTNMSKRHHL